MTTVGQTWLAARRELTARAVVSPDAVASQLMAHVLGLPPGQLLPSQPLTPEQAGRLSGLVRAAGQGRPLQYLTGQAWFRTVCLAVGPGVFIPRPESEVLAGWAIEQVRGGANRVVELCAGSGAIALAIANEAQPSAIWAVEVDPVAMIYLRRNLTGSVAQPVEADLADALPQLNGTIDLVVANPPYLPATGRADLPPDVVAQPERALFGGDDGLALMPAMVEAAGRLLVPGGLAASEHGDDQAEAVSAIFAAAGWVDIESHHDLTGRPRFVTARRAAVG